MAILISSTLVFFGCELPTREDLLQMPVAEDYEVGKLFQSVSQVKSVTILPKPGKSSGGITIFYDGGSTIPQEEGSYAVTFHVAQVPGWHSVRLSAGTLEVNNNKTPTEDHYNIYNIEQISGSVTNVRIEPILLEDGTKPPDGIHNIRYLGNSRDINSSEIDVRALPQEVGVYRVLFDVAATEGWNPAELLMAGELQIFETYRTPVAEQYEPEPLLQNKDYIKPVTINLKQGASSGEITEVRYDDSTELPTEPGSYTVTFDVAAAGIWLKATDLYGGELQITDPDPGALWTLVDDSTFGTSNVRHVAFGGAGNDAKFVAVGDHGKMAYSTDGVRWTEINSTASTFGTKGRINDVMWWGNSFVAVGWDGTKGKVVQSTDGITWGPMPMTGRLNNFEDATAAEVSAVAPHRTTGMLLIMSVTGAGAGGRDDRAPSGNVWWGSNPNTNNPTRNFTNPRGAARLGDSTTSLSSGVWFEVGDAPDPLDRMLTIGNADGGGTWNRLWNTANYPFGTSYINFNGVKTFPSYSNPTIIVAWGDGGKLAFSTSASNNAPANTWKKAEGEALGGRDIYDLTLNNDATRYVAVGSLGSISYSDGQGNDFMKIWKDANRVFGATRINSVVYGKLNGKDVFVAVGEAGKIAFSK